MKTIDEMNRKIDFEIRAGNLVKFLADKYNFSTDLGDAKEILGRVEAFLKWEMKNPQR